MARNPYTDWPGDKLFEARRNVAFTQAKSCWGCLQVGEYALYLWVTNRRAYGWRLELFTEFHRFRWGRGQWASR